MTEVRDVPTKTKTMTGALTFLFAVSGGVVVSNLYWAQPILGDISGDLRVSTESTGLLMTVVQLGYALGVFLFVPLGDSLQRRKMIPIFMGLSALALLASAAAPTFIVLLGALFVVGLTSISGQILTPLAGDLADPQRRGRTVAIVASGLMFGILISRALSGLIADAAGWRIVFAVAAVLSAVFALLLARAVPTVPKRDHAKYGALLRSVLTAPVEFPVLRVLLVLGASTMAIFTMFWTGLTFLLSAAPYNFSVTQIGLISLVGVTGAIAAQNVGRLIDRGWAARTLGVALILTLVTMAVAIFVGGSLVAVLIIVAVSSVGTQSVFVLVQTSAMTVDANARSRLNTVAVVGNFIGGAIGSSLASTMWGVGGWAALAATAAAIALFASIVWLIGRRRLASL